MHSWWTYVAYKWNYGTKPLGYLGRDRGGLEERQVRQDPGDPSDVNPCRPYFHIPLFILLIWFVFTRHVHPQSAPGFQEIHSMRIGG